MAAQWPYSIGITSSTGETRNFVADTSFEPYRREAFRHRSIPSQRQSVQMTNIAGQGTVSTEGLWRREQVEWSMGAGQYSLDKRGDNQETRFYSSKGIDVFSYPFQATLLPDTGSKVSVPSPANNLIGVHCGDYIVVANGTSVIRYDSTWTAYTYANPGFGTINSITSSDSTVFIATTTGIWYSDPTGTSPTFSLFSSVDLSPYNGGFDLVRWTNDQVIASRKNRLYAFQPRPNALGAPPSTGSSSAVITTATGSSSTQYWSATTATPHGLTVGQQFQVTATASNSTMTISNAASGSKISFSGGNVTIIPDSAPTVVVGDVVTVNYTTYTPNNSTVTGSFTDSGVVTSVTGTQFVYTASDSYLVYGGLHYNNYVAATAIGNHTTSLTGTYIVASTGTAYTFTFYDGSITTNQTAYGGTVTSSSKPDVLVTHQNTNWVWSDATGGQTQIYIAGYVNSPVSGPGSGAIYRTTSTSSTTTSSTNLGTNSTTSEVQSFQLNVPVVALPMSPDEYPTCIKAYLNFVFIGTNRGIRMTQTLGQYAPSTTSTSDLKSGPLIPNVLQPTQYPVTSIIGDGRFVWFAWNKYDTASTGLGKLDLSTFINGDTLTPAYASDLMVSYTGSYSQTTGQGMINSLIWDPVNNTPLMVIGGLGIYGPYCVNTTGKPVVSKYVTSGSITSGYFDYGIPDRKVGFGFAVNGACPSTSTFSATVISDPDTTAIKTANISNGVSTLLSVNGTYETTTQIFNDDSSTIIGIEFQVKMTLNASSSSSGNVSPILHRWTLKAWPRIVQGTQISAVFLLHSVNTTDGGEAYYNSYENFIWLENLRQSQDIITYTEGPLSAVAAIETLDWQPHKRKDNYENGFDGDCVVFLKTLAPYVYTPTTTR